MRGTDTGARSLASAGFGKGVHDWFLAQDARRPWAHSVASGSQAAPPASVWSARDCQKAHRARVRAPTGAGSSRHFFVFFTGAFGGGFGGLGGTFTVSFCSATRSATFGSRNTTPPCEIAPISLVFPATNIDPESTM